MAASSAATSAATSSGESTENEIVLAVDSSKLSHRAPARTFPLERIAVLVTELDPRDPLLAPYRAHGEVR